MSDLSALIGSPVGCIEECRKPPVGCQEGGVSGEDMGPSKMDMQRFMQDMGSSTPDMQRFMQDRRSAKMDACMSDEDMSPAKMDACMSDEDMGSAKMDAATSVCQAKTSTQRR